MNTEELNSADPGSRSKPKRRRWRRWFLVVVAALVALRLTVLTNRRVRLEIGPDTTVITGPLNADGTVNYVVYLNERMSKGVTPENNAAAAMTRVLHLPEDEGFSEKTLRFMGLGPGKSDDNPKVVSIDEFLDDAKLDEDMHYDALDDFQEAMSRPWRSEEFPILHDYVKADAKALDATVTAMERPGWYWPMVPRENPARLASCDTIFHQLTYVSDALVTRAMFRAGSGDIEGCMNDLVALHRLAGFVARKEMAFSRLIAVRMSVTASAAESELLRQRKLNATQARSYLKRLDAMAPWPDLVDIANLERFAMLELMQHSRWDLLYMGLHPDLAFTIRMLSGPGDEKDERWTFRSEYDRWLLTAPQDDNLILRRINTTYDRIVSAVKIKDYQGRKKALTKLDRQADPPADKLIPTPLVSLTFARLIGRPGQGIIDRYLADLQPVLVQKCSSDMRIIDEYDVDARVRGSIVRCGLRLQLHHGEKGAWPADAKAAGEIMPDGKLPIDPFDPDGGAFVYRRRGDGYILYSRGKNETDDGGFEDDKNRQGDIVLRVGAPTTRPAKN